VSGATGAGDVAAAVAERAAALAAAFRAIESTRMRGVPLLNPRLRVQAVGFEAGHAQAGDAPDTALGVLVTPWFINLVRLPLTAAAAGALAAVGQTRPRDAGCVRADFIGAQEPGFGRFEACSLFSPVLEFTDQAAALATAREVLRLLREPAPAALSPAAPHAIPRAIPAAPTAPPAPDRRGFLFGRRAAPGA
jgi:[NiFe] hydrogenase assembly HybE family chaperone